MEPTGFEPATSDMQSEHSTSELRSQNSFNLLKFYFN